MGQGAVCSQLELPGWVSRADRRGGCASVSLLSSSACSLQGRRSSPGTDAGCWGFTAMLCVPPPRCGITGPAGLWGPASGQERGCKTNHSCNMRESTWSLRSCKTRRLWQAGPGLLPEGPGLTAAGGRAGAELLQDAHCDVSRTAREHCGAFPGCRCHGETPCQQDLPKPACGLHLLLRACGQLGSAAADPLYWSKV